tara:strand:+ start:452 stop:841 length:390 start_codon:yes stop_codon:yes gene_type:complete
MAVNNSVKLIGHVGKDPEVKTLDNGTKVANFSIAISKSFKDKDGNKQEKTQWFNLVAWRKLAEIVESYIKKGSHLAVEGELTNSAWDDKDGGKKYATEVLLSGILMLDKKAVADASSRVSEGQGGGVPF